jgi:hypothetical protein
MATYYVRLDGNDTNSGLGPATNLAWATISKAFSILASGDTLYIAPGTYRQTSVLNLSTSFSSQVNIFGDPLCLQFPGLAPSPITITTRASSDIGPAAYSGNLINVTSNNVYFKNLALETVTAGYTHLHLNSTYNITVDKCYFYVARDSGTVYFLYHNFYEISSPPTYNITIKNCIFFNIGANATLIGNNGNLGGTTKNWDIGLTIENCIAPNIPFNFQNGGSSPYSAYGITINNSILGTTSFYRIKGRVEVNNSIISYLTYGGQAGAGQTMRNSYVIIGGIENYFSYINSFYGQSVYGVTNFGQYKLWGLNQSEFYSAYGTRGEQGGYVTGSTTDIYGNAWSNSIPDIGPVEGVVNNSAISYIPIERTNNSFTVSPNTTNRTELIYLGAKGLTHTTPSLTASYVRAGAIRTAITLVSQTPNGSWTSGGFCEIDSVNMPGIYRIDVPNAVFVAGAESAMLQLTGLSTSNGAVVHYNMAKVQFDLSQNVPLVNTAHSIGDALNAARAQGFGKWQIVGNTMNIYAEDGITLVKSFNLDSGSYPTQRM